MPPPKPQTIDEYIAGFPDDVQQLLEKIRVAARKAVPKATEAIKYGIPTFVQQGNIVSFAAYKNHVSLYPAPVGVAEFEAEIAPYLASKATLQFPLDKPLPSALVTKVTRYQAKRLSEKAAEKKGES